MISRGHRSPRPYSGYVRSWPGCRASLDSVKWTARPATAESLSRHGILHTLVYVYLQGGVDELVMCTHYWALALFVLHLLAMASGRMMPRLRHVWGEDKIRCAAGITTSMLLLMLAQVFFFWLTINRNGEVLTDALCELIDCDGVLIKALCVQIDVVQVLVNVRFALINGEEVLMNALCALIDHAEVLIKASCVQIDVVGVLVNVPLAQWGGAYGRFMYTGITNDVDVGQVAQIGSSPVFMTVGQMKRVMAEWTNMSIRVFQDKAAQKEWGWVEEMYAFTISCSTSCSHTIDLGPNLML
eukprot:gene11661-34371_t